MSRTPLRVLLAVLMISLSSFAVFAQAQPGPQGPTWPGPWWMWDGGWWIMPIMMLVMLAFWAIIITIVVVVIRKFVLEARHRRGAWVPPWSAAHSSLQILNERFAKGEIQKEEFEQKRAAILAPHD